MRLTVACGEHIATRPEEMSSRSRKEERYSGLDRRKANRIGPCWRVGVDTFPRLHVRGSSCKITRDWTN